MPDYRQDLQFGVFITPVAAQADGGRRARRGWPTSSGLDIVSFQDHPYQPWFLDTWTLLVGRRGARRPTSASRRTSPTCRCARRSVLARSVASLDILSGGRVELGLGAGAFWDGIAAIGGPRLTPGQSVDALAEAIDVIRAIWDAEGRPVRARRRALHASTARSPGRRPRTTSRSGSAPTSRGCCALTGREGRRLAAEHGLRSSSTSCRSMNAAIDEAADGRRAPPERDPPAAQRQRTFGAAAASWGHAAAVGRAARRS